MCAYVLNERTCNISLQLFFQWPQHEVSYLALRFPRQITKFSFWNKTTKKTGNNWPLSQPPVVEFVAHLIFFCFILIRTLLDTKGSDSLLSCLTVSLFYLFYLGFPLSFKFVLSETCSYPFFTLPALWNCRPSSSFVLGELQPLYYENEIYWSREFHNSTNQKFREK